MDVFQRYFMAACLALTALSAAANEIAVSRIHPKCLDRTTKKSKEVTHYMVPLLEAYSARICDQVEGTCIYKRDGVQYLHNFGYPDVPLADAHCKNGWGNQQNCLHPCRTIAASMRHHDFGQILFLKELVGQRCGNLARDGFEIIHDGFVVVGDTGSPSHFNAVGRFDFFWGRCANQRGGECFEGAIPISRDTTDSDFCMVWDPNRPSLNQDLKNSFVNRVRDEDVQRSDFGAAADFNL